MKINILATGLRTAHLAIAFLAIASSAAYADPASHRKVAENFLKESNIEKQLQNTIAQMLEIQIKGNPNLAPFRDTMEEFFAKYISWESLKEDMITIYTDAYTEDELNELLAFQRSPLGRKSIEKMPAITSQSMELGVRRVRENQVELAFMVQEKIRQMANTGGK